MNGQDSTSEGWQVLLGAVCPRGMAWGYLRAGPAVTEGSGWTGSYMQEEWRGLEQSSYHSVACEPG